MNTVIVWLLQWILPRRFWYRNLYLWSRHWREIRYVKLCSVDYHCARCKHKPSYDVHHLTYERIWHERLKDLQVLCRTCHQLEHQKG